MHEYVTDAVVLGYEPAGDADRRVYLLTKSFGMLPARAKSARKITSKLAGHLEPGMVSRVRLIEKKGIQVADAYKIREGVHELPMLMMLRRLIPEGEPDRTLYAMVAAKEPFSWAKALAAIGYDPEHATCAKCGETAPVRFLVRDQHFYCVRDASKFSANEVISIE